MKNAKAAILSALFAVSLSACSGGMPSTSSTMSTLPQLPTAPTNTQTGGHAISSLAKQIAATATNLHYHIFPRPGLRKFPSVMTGSVSYPVDLQNHGGATQATAVEHNVYLTIVTTPNTTATPAPASY